MIKKHLDGFLGFIREQGVVGLATGFILGGAISKLVSSLVKDIVNPILGIFLGAAGDLVDKSLVVGKSTIMYGQFLNNLIDFLLISGVVYVLVKVMGVDKLDKKK